MRFEPLSVACFQGIVLQPLHRRFPVRKMRKSIVELESQLGTRLILPILQARRPLLNLPGLQKIPVQAQREWV